MYLLKTLFWLLRKQSGVPTMFIFVKSIFSNLLRKKDCLNYQEVRNSRIKIKEFDGKEEVGFGSSYFEVLQIEGLDSIRF